MLSLYQEHLLLSVHWLSSSCVRWCGDWWRRQKIYMSAGLRASFVRYPARSLQYRHPAECRSGPVRRRATHSRTPAEHRPIIGRESTDCRPNYNCGIFQILVKNRPTVCRRFHGPCPGSVRAPFMYHCCPTYRPIFIRRVDTGRFLEIGHAGRRPADF